MAIVPSLFLLLDTSAEISRTPPSIFILPANDTASSWKEERVGVCTGLVAVPDAEKEATAAGLGAYEATVEIEEVDEMLRTDVDGT